jgi:hypothetical protein
MECAWCHSENVRWLCKGCKSTTGFETAYCSRECQSKHWNEGGHHLACGLLTPFSGGGGVDVKTEMIGMPQGAGSKRGRYFEPLEPSPTPNRAPRETIDIETLRQAIRTTLQSDPERNVSLADVDAFLAMFNNANNHREVSIHQLMAVLLGRFSQSVYLPRLVLVEIVRMLDPIDWKASTLVATAWNDAVRYVLSTLAPEVRRDVAEAWALHYDEERFRMITLEHCETLVRGDHAYALEMARRMDAYVVDDCLQVLFLLACESNAERTVHYLANVGFELAIASKLASWVPVITAHPVEIFVEEMRWWNALESSVKTGNVDLARFVYAFPERFNAPLPVLNRARLTDDREKRILLLQLDKRGSVAMLDFLLETLPIDPSQIESLQTTALAIVKRGESDSDALELIKRFRVVFPATLHHTSVEAYRDREDARNYVEDWVRAAAESGSVAMFALVWESVTDEPGEFRMYYRLWDQILFNGNLPILQYCTERYYLPIELLRARDHNLVRMALSNRKHNLEMFEWLRTTRHHAGPEYSSFESLTDVDFVVGLQNPDAVQTLCEAGNVETLRRFLDVFSTQLLSADNNNAVDLRRAFVAAATPAFVNRKNHNDDRLPTIRLLMDRFSSRLFEKITESVAWDRIDASVHDGAYETATYMFEQFVVPRVVVAARAAGARHVTLLELNRLQLDMCILAHGLAHGNAKVVERLLRERNIDARWRSPTSRELNAAGTVNALAMNACQYDPGVPFFEAFSIYFKYMFEERFPNSNATLSMLLTKHGDLFTVEAMSKLCSRLTVEKHSFALMRLVWAVLASRPYRSANPLVIKNDVRVINSQTFDAAVAAGNYDVSRYVMLLDPVTAVNRVYNNHNSHTKKLMQHVKEMRASVIANQ